MKFCKDCKHFRPLSVDMWFIPPDTSSCIHPSVAVINPVYGTVKGKNAGEMRRVQCGPEARLFEPKIKPVETLPLKEDQSPSWGDYLKWLINNKKK